MKVLIQPSRLIKIFLSTLLVVTSLAIMIPRTEMYHEWLFEGKAKNREGIIRSAQVNASPFHPVSVPLAAPSGFTPQVRLGFGQTPENEWEPAIASDRFGHVYVLYPQYGGVPGCGDCYSPTMILQVS